MKKTILASTLLSLLALSAVANAQSITSIGTLAIAADSTQITPVNDNWKNGDGTLIWTNSYGDCWNDAEWTQSTANTKCGKPVVSKPPAVKEILKENEVIKEKLTITGDTLFVFDKDVLTDTGKKSLDGALSRIKSLQHVDSIQVMGYTDSFGSEAYNLNLSQRRATAIAKYLETQGYKNVTAVGKGKHDFVVDGSTFKGERKAKIEFEQPNRRVELNVTGYKEVVRERM